MGRNRFNIVTNIIYKISFTLRLIDNSLHFSKGNKGRMIKNFVLSYLTEIIAIDGSVRVMES